MAGKLLLVTVGKLLVLSPDILNGRSRTLAHGDPRQQAGSLANRQRRCPGRKLRDPVRPRSGRMADAAQNHEVLRLVCAPVRQSHATSKLQPGTGRQAVNRPTTQLAGGTGALKDSLTGRCADGRPRPLFALHRIPDSDTRLHKPLLCLVKAGILTAGVDNPSIVPKIPNASIDLRCVGERCPKLALSKGVPRAYFLHQPQRTSQQSATVRIPPVGQILSPCGSHVPPLTLSSRHARLYTMSRPAGTGRWVAGVSAGITVLASGTGIAQSPSGGYLRGFLNYVELYQVRALHSTE